MLLSNLLSTDLLAPDFVSLAAVFDVVRLAVMVLFLISALLVVLVVLAQEGKGGGLAGAFGGAGAETFGVKAGTVNKFTAWLAAAFLGLALLHAGLGRFEKKKPTAPSLSGLEGDDESTKGADKAEDPNPKKKGDKKPGDKKPGDDGKKDDAKKDEGDKKPGDDTKSDDGTKKKDDK